MLTDHEARKLNDTIREQAETIADLNRKYESRSLDAAFHETRADQIANKAREFAQGHFELEQQWAEAQKPSPICAPKYARNLIIY